MRNYVKSQTGSFWDAVKDGSLLQVDFHQDSSGPNISAKVNVYFEIEPFLNPLLQNNNNHFLQHGGFNSLHGTDFVVRHLLWYIPPTPIGGRADPWTLWSVKSDLCILAFHRHTNKMALDHPLSQLCQKNPPFLWFLHALFDSLQRHPQWDWPIISVNSANWYLTNAVSHEGSPIIISQLFEEHWGFERKRLKISALCELAILGDLTAVGKRIANRVPFDGCANRWQI